MLDILIFDIEQQDDINIPTTNGKSCSLCGVTFATLEEQVYTTYSNCSLTSSQTLSLSSFLQGLW